MDGFTAKESTALVAACKASAAHRRDHHHAADVTCHHVVQVVHLGHRVVAVSIDCESGFLPEREAEAVAHTHGSTATSALRIL
jgi:hypothetical protein